MGAGRGRSRRARSATSAVPVSVQAQPLTVDDARQLCEEHNIDFAPAIDANFFYHVTCEDDLPSIAEQGLRPGSEVGRRNFHDYHRDDECVYLFPGVGNAQTYVGAHEDRFDGKKRVILQVESVDAAKLCPDHECFANFWEDWNDEYPSPEHALITRIHNELGGELPAPGFHMDYSQAAEVIRRIDAETRFLLANICALRGDPIMVRDPVPPTSISVARLNDIEQLMERFDELHSEFRWRDDEDGDAEERRYEAFDAWFAENFDGVNDFPNFEEMENLFCDPSEMAENEELRYFNLTPLVS